MDELIEEFLAEASDGLQTLDNELVDLERNPENTALLGSIFRVMHTIKGTCGFLGLDKLASIAHAGENVMDKLRNNQLKVTPDIVSLVFEVVDNIKVIISYIKEHGVEPDQNYSALIARINSVSANEVLIEELVKSEEISLNNKNSQIIDNGKAVIQDEKDNILENKEIKTDQTEESLIKIDNQKSSTNLEKQSTEKKTVRAEHNVAQTIKVNVDVLESLMQIVSELVLNRNQLIQLDRTLRDNRFTSPIQRLNSITSSLQETVMETRMQPISNAWVKIPRMIRDLSKELNKKIKLVMIGEETELDRQLIESIKDPLVHMIRNSADHGIETSEQRLAAGKTEEGTITLKAYHQGGHIIIEISDDGRGLNIGKIKNKILQNNLAKEQDLEQMSETQIQQFIFRAGFSTAEKVTAVSGRGVGMDVVKNNIEEIRGAVELKSIEGKGSTFVIKIPLTLAIMPILVVAVADYKFGLPQINVIEMVKTGADSNHVIEEINDTKILRLRDSLLPLITLSEILQINNDKNNKEGVDYVVVCEVSGVNFGVVVDKIYDTEEIVLKPVSKLLKSISVYSGNTLLGNGDVIMIVDPSGLVKYLTEINKNDDLYASNNHKKGLEHRLSSFLVLKSGTSMKAIPLELISRLEEIDVTKIEIAGGKQVIQYRGSLMFLANLDPNYKIPSNGMQQVVVFGSNDHVLGLIVEEILDIVEQDIESSLSFEESDLTALVLGGKTMDVVDINKFFHQTFFSSSPPIQSVPVNKNYNILFVDDSPFFRKIIINLLSEKGFNVLSAKTAVEALKMLKEQENYFHLIITDINMPYMDGFQFSNACSLDEGLKNIPLIALTSNIEMANNNDKLISSGIKHCLSKTSQDELIPLIFSLLNIRRS